MVRQVAALIAVAPQQRAAFIEELGVEQTQKGQRDAVHQRPAVLRACGVHVKKLLHVTGYQQRAQTRCRAEAKADAAVGIDLQIEIAAVLSRGEVLAEDITVVLALGSHRKHTEEEMRKLVGERCWQEVKCVDSDVNDCVHLGVTKAGTPVDITRVVAEADVRICLGNIEFHYFAGYSGGAKAIMPGVSTPAAIQQNHRMMVSPDACAGQLEGNPVRADIEEAGEICGIDYIVTVVLDEHKKIVYAVAGDVTAAHRVGCAYLDKMYRKKLPQRADIVLVSQGGAPKDANLYQVQKALDNAKHAVRDGGTIILMGACPEGLGSKTFERWLRAAPTAHSMVEEIGRNFELGGHKAAAIGMVLDRARVDLISEMDDDFVRSIFLNPQPTAQAAFDAAMETYGEDATVIAMPYGGATLPYVE